MNDTPDNLSGIIQRGLQKEIDRITNEEVEKAIKTANENVNRRVREMATSAAANVLQRFTMASRGSELVIRVDFSTDENCRGGGVS